MSTATTASDFTVPLIGGHNHFLLRRLHSLTGLVFGGYLDRSPACQRHDRAGRRRTISSRLTRFIRCRFLPSIEWTFIYIPILYHTIYGIWITLTGQPNVTQYPYGKNIFYVLQRASAMVIVAFLFFHVLALKYGLFGTNLSFDHTQALPTIVRHMHTGWWVVWIVYPLGILASCFHLANGFWTAAITWGLTISAAAQRRWARSVRRCLC